MPRTAQHPPRITAADQPLCWTCILLTCAAAWFGTLFLGAIVYGAAVIGMANWHEAQLARQEAFSDFRSASMEAGR